MKRLILITLTVFIYSISFSQEGAEHKITNIIGAGKVEINAGKQFNVQVGDVFQVFGKAQVIHPATGKLIERDNVYLGKIKVIEVKELSSIAAQIEKKKSFSVGNKIVKVTSETLPVVEKKKPLEGQFENPKKRDYSETIYSTQKKSKVNPKVTVLGIRDTSALIDKGTSHYLKKNNQFLVYRPQFETSTIDKSQIEIGKKKVGKIKVLDALQNESLINFKPDSGITALQKDEYFYIKRTNYFEFSFSIEAAFEDYGFGYSAPKFGVIYNFSPYTFVGAEWFYPIFGHSVKSSISCFDFKVGISPLISKQNDYSKYLFFGIQYSTLKANENYKYSSGYKYESHNRDFSKNIGFFIGSQYKKILVEISVNFGKISTQDYRENYEYDYLSGKNKWITSTNNYIYNVLYLNFRIGYMF